MNDKKNLTTEFWVGLFMVFGLGSIAYLCMNIASVKIFNTGFYNVTAKFESVSGLKVGAPVELAGVSIGEVSDIDLEQTEAVMTLSIKNEFKLRDDDYFVIRTKGIIGDRFVKVIPGGSEEPLKSGASTNNTESPMEFEEIISKVIHKME